HRESRRQGHLPAGYGENRRGSDRRRCLLRRTMPRHHRARRGTRADLIAMYVLKHGIKKNPEKRWALPDRIFFGHGACAILAGAGNHIYAASSVMRKKMDAS